jgi:hypothetical protein
VAPDPETSRALLASIGSFAALLTDKAEALFAAGETYDAHEHLLGAWVVFGWSSAWGHLDRFSAYWAFVRAQPSPPPSPA